MRYSNFTQTAIEAAKAAGEVLSYYFGKSIRVREKQGAGLVTNADTEAERAAIQILRKAQPAFEIVAEESASQADTGKIRGGRWIIDPLDGTTNFVHGFPMFCVSIAAEVGGQIRSGVVFHPVFNDLYVAEIGKGAFVNAHRMRVSKTARLPESLLSTGFAYRKNRWLRAEMRAFERMSRVARAVRRPGSAALDLAYVARGVFDGFWERRLAPWDTAAGSILVTEAGGAVTDFQGKPYALSKPEVLASNGRIHKALLSEVRS